MYPDKKHRIRVLIFSAVAALLSGVAGGFVGSAIISWLTKR